MYHDILDQKLTVSWKDTKTQIFQVDLEELLQLEEFKL